MICEHTHDASLAHQKAGNITPNVPKMVKVTLGPLQERLWCNFTQKAIFCGTCAFAMLLQHPAGCVDVTFSFNFHPGCLCKQALQTCAAEVHSTPQKAAPGNAQVVPHGHLCAPKAHEKCTLGTQTVQGILLKALGVIRVQAPNTQKSYSEWIRICAQSEGNV